MDIVRWTVLQVIIKIPKVDNVKNARIIAKLVMRRVQLVLIKLSMIVKLTPAKVDFI